jgi:hypothetical protein
VKIRLARFLPPLIVSFTVLICIPSQKLPAQQMHQHAPVIPSTTLTLTYKGNIVTLTPAELAAMPHTTVTVFNAHNKKNETYSGVPLATLLGKLEVPQGETVHGPLFMTAVIAEGTDGYKVLYSIAEIDPAIHTGQVLVADTLDGKPIIADGAFKLVSTEEKRPARWVRNLDKISVITVTP